MSHVPQSRTGMIVLRLLDLEESPDGPQVWVCGKDVETDKNTVEPSARVAMDVPRLSGKHFKRGLPPKDLLAKTRAKLAVSKRGV